eukprot:m.7144 g.7144  ORF g.7144 m.7144 type:complete len:289 (-) comp2835_c0_seq1:308-1174(-)
MGLGGKVPAVLLAVAAVCILAGTSLLWKVVDDENVFLVLQSTGLKAQSQKGEQFYITFFWFSLIASAAAGAIKHSLLTVIAAGVLGNIFTDTFSLETLDSVRILKERGTASVFEDELNEFAAGSVLAYLGICLALLAATLSQQQPLSALTTSPKVARIMAIAAVVPTVIGCITLWTSSAIALPANPLIPNPNRYRLFEVTEVATTSLFLTLLGVAFGVWGMTAAATFFSAYNVYVLGLYFDSETTILEDSDKQQVAAGVAFCWLGLLINCATGVVAGNAAARQEYTSV